ncbi:lectin C-type domain protein, partial [Ancylostoma caninum]
LNRIPEYSQPGSPNVDRLQKLASPGYSFSNAYNLVPDTKIPELLAKANCFCPDPYVPYTYGNAEPKYGCYSMPQATATQKLAEKVCKLKKQGTLAKVENYEKAQFLMGKVSYPQNAWIGLKRINKKWTWPDGSILTGGSFEMWKPGSLNYNENSCVTMYINRTDYKYYWEPESCTKRQKYICQIKPCSASNYCSEVFNAQRLDSLRKTLGAKLLKHL